MDDTSSAVNSAPASSGPTTFAEAFASDASPAAETSSQSVNAAAAEQPTTDGASAAPATEDRSPFIPRERFDEVNTKYKELQSWREQYGWAESVNREQLEQISQVAQKYQADKVAFLQELIAEVQNDPTDGARLRSLAARALSHGRGQQQAPAGPDIDRVVIDLGNGESIALADLKQSWLNEVRKELEPVTKTVQQVEAERAQLKAQHDAQRFATETVGEASKYPGMDSAENRMKVAERIKAYGLTSDDPRDLRLALDRAWREVVMPTLSSKAQSQLLDNLQQKAAASSSVNPGSAAPATTKTITSFHDKSLQW